MMELLSFRITDLLPGNKPPWVVPAKGRYLTLDTKRAMKYFGLPNVSIPDFFPMSTLLVSTSKPVANPELC